MNFVICIVGIVGACVLIGAGLGYVFAPAASQQLLKTTAISLGMLVCFLFVVSGLAREHPVGFVLAILVLSPVAYVVRERRLRQPDKRVLHGIERTPMMPRQISDEDV